MIKKPKENEESYCEFDENCRADRIGEKKGAAIEPEEVTRPESGCDIPDWVAESRGAINTKEKEGSKPGKDYCSWDEQC